MEKSESIILEVETRDEGGKNACRRMRAKGRVPGIVYGLDRPPFRVAVDPRKIENLLKLGSGKNTVFTLSLAGQQTKRDAMIRELQRDPVTELPLHVDFIRIDTTKAVHVRVPIRLQGLASGVKNEGGIMDFVHREVEVECLPGAIPEHLEVDVSPLHINQHVAFKDLAAAEGVTVLGDPEEIIAVVVAPKVEEAPVTEEEEEAAAAAAVEGEGEGEAGESEAGEKGKEAEGGESKS
jgi:large subunit ribosomal protein L25